MSKVKPCAGAPSPDEMAATFWICPGCDATALTALRALIAAHRYERSAGQVTKFERDRASSVYIVLSGWMLASKSTEEGKRQIIDIVLPGGILNPVSASGDTSMLELEALCDVVIAAIPQDEWLRTCNAHPDLARMFNRYIQSTLARMSERMLRLGKGTAENNIAFTLCELCLRSTEHGPVNGREFHIPLTQQQLGDYCGLSAIHICRTLRRFSRRGILEVGGHMDIVIHDVEAMTRLAGIDLDVLRQDLIPAA